MIYGSIPNTKEWLELKSHYQHIKDYHLRDLFNSDEDRGSEFSIEDDDFLFDFSKNRITAKTMGLLMNLARASYLEKEIEALFSGEKINKTEKRAVLHTALRNPETTPDQYKEGDIISQINRSHFHMKTIAEKIRRGDWKGITGKPIRNIIHVGIGGSILGVEMICNALKTYCHPELNICFLANLDGSELAEKLEKINIEETLFIIVSKTFSTMETLKNAESIKERLKSVFTTDRVLEKHMLAVTAKREKARHFGVDQDNILEMWDWVGGRFSSFSAVGLSIMIMIGFDQFRQLLAGAHAIDNHFRRTPLEKNIPVIMALLGIWYNQFFQSETHAVIPYNQSLKHFVRYIQALDMESNGKSVDRQGKPINYHTSPIVWGDIGSDCQHAFFQILHQGTRLIPCDFIGFIQPNHHLADHHQKLMANFFAQTESLALGDLDHHLMNIQDKEGLNPFRVFPGNRPTTTFLFNKLIPYTLGKLIYLYEHKTFCQGVFWNIYSFDQWGVELGKIMTKRIIAELNSMDRDWKRHDSSTAKLIDYYLKHSR